MKIITALLVASLATPLSAQLLLPENALPEYEQDIDHARLIKQTDKKTIALGRKIYDNLCMNCHGTVDKAGSIP
ncbi:MAG: hypothetical protein ACPHNY_09150, partial [Akkermansiaceae bacterium]